MPQIQQKPAENKQRLWYIKKNNTIKGPYTEQAISRFILLQNILPDDELSQDKVNWKKATACRSLLPQQLKNMGDEMVQERVYALRRSELKQKKVIKENAELASTWNILLIVLLIGITLGAFLWFTPKHTDIDCTAKIVAQGDFSGCNFANQQWLGKSWQQLIMQNANLKKIKMYQMDLSTANFSYAMMDAALLRSIDFQQAVLTGASLQGAILMDVNFTGADLRYVNLLDAKPQNIRLNNARLDGATWFDGNICSKGSYGRCLQTH